LIDKYIADLQQLGMLDGRQKRDTSVPERP